MAFTLRLDEKHESVLDELCTDLNMSAKTKAIIWLIENYPKTKKERDHYFRVMNSQAADLVAVRKAIRQQHEANALLMTFANEKSK